MAGRLIYVNRLDHASFVPRRFGVGWTPRQSRTAMQLAGRAALIVLFLVLRFSG
jgi:uncharacterized membrane protein